MLYYIVCFWFPQIGKFACDNLRPLMTDSRTKTTIHIANVDYGLTRDILHAAFLPFGDIVDVELPVDELSGFPHKGFAHIEYEDPEDAKAAIDNMDDSEIYGRVIHVTPAKAMREAYEGLGSKVPLWQQEGFIQKYMVSDEDREAQGNAEREEKKSGSLPMLGMQRDLPVGVGPLQQ